MNASLFKIQWQQLKGAAKTQWDRLTDEDIARVRGDVEQLIGRVQERYGYASERTRQEVEAFLNRQVPRASFVRSERLHVERGAIGYSVLWLLGVPASILLVIFFLLSGFS